MQFNSLSPDQWLRPDGQADILLQKYEYIIGRIVLNGTYEANDWRTGIIN